MEAAFLDVFQPFARRAGVGDDVIEDPVEEDARAHDHEGDQEELEGTDEGARGVGARNLGRLGDLLL